MRIPFRQLASQLKSDGSVTMLVLVPRACALVSQWILSATVPAAGFVLYSEAIATGSMFPAWIVNGIPGILAHRYRGLSYKRFRNHMGAALLVLGLCVGLSALGFQLFYRKAPIHAALLSMLYGVAGVVGAGSGALWLFWIASGRYLRVFAWTLTYSGLAAWSLAVLGFASISGTLSAFGFAQSGLGLLGPAINWRRTARVLTYLLRKSFAPSVAGGVAAVVYPTALIQGQKIWNSHELRDQILLITVLQVFPIVSGNTASRILVANKKDNKEAFRKWAIVVTFLSVVLWLFYFAYMCFPWRPMRLSLRQVPPALCIAAISFVVSDPLVYLFSSRYSQYRIRPEYSLISCVLIWWWLLIYPDWLIRRAGLLGPSGMVAALRLVPLAVHGRSKTIAALFITLVMGYGALFSITK